MIRLDRTAAEPLQKQLYRQIRDELRSGSFADRASRLPSSRALAADLGISRLTVSLAFSKLHAEGYLQSKVRSGTFVADPLPEMFLNAVKPTEAPAIERPLRISDRVKAIPDQRVRKQFDLGALEAGAGVSLVPGLPAVDEFPIGIWERLRSQVLAQRGAHLLRHASSRGDVDLRKAVATYLCDFRGARCHPDQILIVGGMQQAMLISAMALLDPGEPVWIEDPGFHQARRVFILAGAKVVPKPLDQEGIVIARSPKEKQPKMIHVTPSHQYPLGMTMSFERRTALLDFARAHNAFIFEDDFYAEFRFTGLPLPCLQGIDDFSRVIYAGTMSKILFPSLRLGYLVAPEQLIDPLVKIRSTMDQHSSAIDQATLARFIDEGFFLSHTSNECENSTLSGESSSLKNSISCSVIASSFRFPRRDSTSLPGFDAKQISRESRVLARRSESNRHRYRFIASRRTSSQRLFLVLLRGRPRKFEKASSDLCLHSNNTQM